MITWLTKDTCPWFYDLMGLPDGKTAVYQGDGIFFAIQNDTRRVHTVLAAITGADRRDKPEEATAKPQDRNELTHMLDHMIESKISLKETS